MTTGNAPLDILPVSQVTELINGLVKALRAFHMYLPNNPIYQRATDNLRGAFAPIWARASSGRALRPSSEVPCPMWRETLSPTLKVSPPKKEQP